MTRGSYVSGWKAAGDTLQEWRPPPPPLVSSEHEPDPDAAAKASAKALLLLIVRQSPGMNPRVAVRTLALGSSSVWDCASWKLRSHMMSSGVLLLWATILVPRLIMETALEEMRISADKPWEEATRVTGNRVVAWRHASGRSGGRWGLGGRGFQERTGAQEQVGGRRRVVAGVSARSKRLSEGGEQGGAGTNGV